jgi:hypothetical protein
MKNILKIILCMLILVSFYCNKDDFTPVDKFESNVIVHAVLDLRKNIQFVKIQQSFYNLTSNQNEKILKNLNAKLIESSGKFYLLRDTIINGLSDYSVLYNKDIVLKPGGYTLIINSDNFPTVWGTVNIPQEQQIGISYHTDRIGIDLLPNLATKGFTYRFYIHYTINQGGTLVNGTDEIPYQINDATDESSIIYFRGFVQKKGFYSHDSISVLNKCLKYALKKIEKKANSQTFTYDSCSVVIDNLDWNLFDYLQSINGFNDPYSIRLDVTAFSNIIGGYGVFGAIRSDTMNIPHFNILAPTRSRTK